MIALQYVASKKKSKKLQRKHENILSSDELKMFIKE